MKERHHPKIEAFSHWKPRSLSIHFSDFKEISAW
jgi:hypothetical protein